MPARAARRWARKRYASRTSRPCSSRKASKSPTAATCKGPATPDFRPLTATGIFPRSSAWNRAVHEACRAEFAAARLPILVGGDHSLAIGSIAAAAQHASAERPEVSRALVRRARGHQYERAHAERQHSRHAGRDPAWPRAARNWSRSAGRRPSMQSVRDPPDRHPQRRSGREALRARARLRSLRHALHRRDRHAADHACSARRPRPRHAPARQLRRRFPRPGHRAGRRHHGTGRAVLSRGAAVHGDGGRYGTARLARHHGAQSGARRPQPLGGGHRRSRRLAVRQEHPHEAQPTMLNPEVPIEYCDAGPDRNRGEPRRPQLQAARRRPGARPGRLGLGQRRASATSIACRRTRR